MTCRAGSRRGAGAVRAGRSGSPASSPARRARTWRGAIIPDDTISHFPQGACSCGADLKDARDLGVKYSHQVTDLPEATAQTIQHDRHEAECSCGRRHVADAPPQAAGAPGTVTYGLNAQAW